MGAKYNANPMDAYKLELSKLQLYFSELQKLGEEVSELSKVGWRQVDHLKHMNFIIQEATMTGEALLKLP